jgi:hypothetical protein
MKKIVFIDLDNIEEYPEDAQALIRAPSIMKNTPQM